MNDTGAPIMIPVGPETLGRIINVIGDPIDERGPVPTDKRQVRPYKDLFVTSFLCVVYPDPDLLLSGESGSELPESVV